MRTLPSTEPAVAIPGIDHIRAAFAALTADHVDVDTARDCIAETVDQVAKEVREAQVHTPAPKRPARTDEDRPDLYRIPARGEWAMIHRTLRLCLAIVNGRRRHLDALNDRHLATAAGRTTLNAAATIRQRASRTQHPVRAPKVHANAVEGNNRTTFYVDGLIAWDNRPRALSLTIVRDRRGTCRITGFFIL